MTMGRGGECPECTSVERGGREKCKNIHCFCSFPYVIELITGGKQ